MEKKQLTVEEVRPVLEKVLSLTFAYLDQAVKEVNEMDFSNLKNFTDLEKHTFNKLHKDIAIGLSITHRSYPLCYDLFPDSKANLDNVDAMFKRFKAGGLIQECPCLYCEENTPKSPDKSAPDKSAPDKSAPDKSVEPDLNNSL